MINIFNIRAGAQWVGMTGVRRGFVEFQNRDYAIRAWLLLMRTYRRRYGCRTVRQIVTRYAPPTENDTRSYVDFCARHIGIGADEQLTSLTQYAALAQAMARMETGTRIQQDDVLEAMNKFYIII